jgi:hypothetical protein
MVKIGSQDMVAYFCMENLKKNGPDDLPTNFFLSLVHSIGGGGQLK